MQYAATLIALRSLAYCITWPIQRLDGAYCYLCCVQAAKCASDYIAKLRDAALWKRERLLSSAAIVQPVMILGSVAKIYLIVMATVGGEELRAMLTSTA